MSPALQACSELAARGEFDAAIAALRQLLAKSPQLPGAWNLLVNALAAAGRTGEALNALDAAAEISPGDPGLHLVRKNLLLASGRIAEAYLAELSYKALQSGSAEALFKLGTIYYFERRLDLADKWYALAGLVDPDATVLWHRNLSNDLWGRGQFEDARFHRHAAFSKQCVFTERAEFPEIAILVLCSGTRGDVPVDALFDKTSATLVKWVADYAQANRGCALPPFDAIFNAIGDADLHEELPAAALEIMRHSGKPILNPPERVKNTARTRIPELFPDVAHVLIPPSIRIPRERLPAFARQPAPMKFPLLLRPVGSHGGEFLVRLDHPGQAGSAVPDADSFIATQYVDYPSADGYYRKYRAVFIGRGIYPYHLAISEHWMVHYETANMYESAWKLDEENRYLGGMEEALGEKAMAALKTLAARLDLDYCGVDFSRLPDGSLLVFEINPAMLVHFEAQDARFALKNRTVENIRAAFAERLRQARAVPP